MFASITLPNDPLHHASTYLRVGVSQAKKEHTRLKRASQLSLSSVDSDWLRGHNWRLNPRWRYCFLNDSDHEISHEGGLREYLKQMRSSGDWPNLCRPRRRLVERLLLDVEATADFNALWDRDWERNKENGVHLTFFSTPAGLIRFMNQSLDESVFYEHPDGLAENNTEL